VRVMPRCFWGVGGHGVIWTTLAVVLLSSLGVHSQESCLTDAVPVSQRRSVKIDGQEGPVGMLIFSWQSATFVGELFKLIAEEVMGFHVEVTMRTWEPQAGLWALAGCREVVTGIEEARSKCDLGSPSIVSQTHLVLENWDFTLKRTLRDLTSEYPDRRPILSGTLGFEGVSAPWLPIEVMDAARADNIFLDHYRSYNSSAFNPAQYFSSVAEINSTAFFSTASRCANYPPFNSDEDVRNYMRHFPEDTEGVESYTTSGGEVAYRAFCEDGVWWLSPACRADRTKCIPWISFNGKGYEMIWQKTAAYNIPLAMASTDNWVEIVYQFRVMSYAWIPDALFADRPLTQILFPSYSKDQHDDDLYVTKFAQVATQKWAHADLQEQAPRLWEAMDRMTLVRSLVRTTLEAQMRSGLSGRDAACQFLKDNRSVWQAWIPDATSCPNRQGLTFVNGQPQCAWCARGTFSDQHPTIPGSRLCVNCTAGSFQENTQSSSCEKCPSGRYSENAGATSCQQCDIGFLQEEIGTTGCSQCPDGRTTTVLGAQSMLDCVCSEGSYEPLGVSCSNRNHSCECGPCGVGLNCEVGSSLAHWNEKYAGNISDDLEEEMHYPMVLPGYFATADNPVSIYKCFRPQDCPGGDPGSCGAWRSGYACGKCDQGYYMFAYECHPCTDLEMGSFLFPVLPLLLLPAVVLFVQARMQEPMRAWIMDSPKNRALSLIPHLLVIMQTLGLIRSTRAQLKKELLMPMEISHLLTMGLDVLRPECAANGEDGDFSYLFIWRTLLPGIIGLYFLLTWVAVVLTWKVVERIESARRSFVGKCVESATNGVSMWNAFGMIMYTFSIPLYATAFLLFQCYDHPNGSHSVMWQPDALCESELWNGLVNLGVLAILLYVATSLALVIYVVRISPMRFGSLRFRQQWKFILVKWRPRRWWFAAIFLAKNLLLCMALPLFPGGPLQLLWTEAVMVAYVTMVLMVLPWRHRWSNIIDSVATMSLLLLSMCCLVYTERDGDVEGVVSAFLLAFTILPLLPVGGGLCVLGYLFWRYPAIEDVDALRTALIAEANIHQIKKCTILDLISCMANATTIDRRMIHMSLAVLTSEVTMKPVPGTWRRIIQRQTSDVDQTRPDGPSVDQARLAIRRYVDSLGEKYEEEAHRVFQNNSQVTTDHFAEAVGSRAGQHCGKIMATILDIRQNGTVLADVYLTYVKNARSSSTDLDEVLAKQDAKSAEALKLAQKDMSLRSSASLVEPETKIPEALMEPETKIPEVLDFVPGEEPSLSVPKVLAVRGTSAHSEI